MKFAFLAGLDLNSWTPEDVVRALKEFEYEGIEWPLSHIHPRTRSRKENAAVVKATRDAGLEVSELVVRQNCVWFDAEKRKDAIALTKECLELCAQLGISAINVFTGPPPWDPNAAKVGSNIREG